MTSFFLQQADYLDVLYGFLLVLVGMIGYSLWRGKDSKLPWKWLALYGLVAGFLEWLEVFAFQLDGDLRFSIVKTLLVALSYACLAEFGREALRAKGARVPGPWIHVVLLSLALPASLLDIRALPSALGLSMGVPGSILAALAFIRAAGSEHPSGGMLRSAGIVMAVYAVIVAIVPAAPFWPASVVNEASFAALTGLPVSVPHTIMLSILCVILRREYLGTLRARSAGIVGAIVGKPYFALVMIAILAAGWVGTQVAGMRGAEEARAQLGYETDIIASAVNPARLWSLTLTSADLTNPDYRRLREQLVAMAAASPDVQLITLTIERDSRVFFVADSLPQGLSTRAQPGDLYDEHPTELRTVSATGVRAIAGPYTDRRGTFLSGFYAIRDLASGEVRGVLGVDWDYARYSLAIARNRLIPLCLTIIACLAVLAYQLYRQRGREVARLLASSERRMGLAQSISRVGSWTKDCRTGKSEWSAEMFSIFGVDPGRGTPTLEEQRAFLSEKDWKREIDAEERAERDGVGFEVDFRIVRPDGGVRYVVSHGEPVRGQNGRVASVAGIVQDLTARHEAQAQVERLTRQMEFILSAARTGLDIIDSSYNVRYVDPGWQKVYGDPAGRKCFEYFMGRATPCVDCGIVRALAEKTISVSEEILPKEGNRPIQVTTIPFQSEDGEWLVAEVNVDITERKCIEESLKVAKEYAENLVRRANVMVIGLDLLGKVTVFNHAAEVITGYTFAEVAGENWFELAVPRERYPQVWEAFRRLPDGLMPRSCENPILTKSGEERYIGWQNNEVRDQSRITGSISFGMDMTERRHMEEKHTRLAALVESSDDAIVGFGMDRTITVWNRGAERIYGYSAAEIIGRQTSMLIPPDREDEAGDMRERLACGERIEGYETMRRRKDGALINVALTLSTIRDSEGKPIGMASVARDITADKAVQAQLIRAQRLESLGTLAGGIAHQFNNINAVIHGYLQILAMGELQGQALAYVQEALKGVQRAVDITDRLLGFTNVSSSEGETSHLEDVARSILPLLTDQFKEAGVLLSDELVTTTAVKASASMISFIVMGLLSNALHAVLGMKERIVSIRTGVLPGLSFLEVSDTGCGMVLEDVRRVFTPFFTTKGEWASKGSPQAGNHGIGLTLAVSQATAAAQGGRIEVQSVPGQGSTFRLLLPVASAQPLPSTVRIQ